VSHLGVYERGALYMWTQVTIIIYSNKANALFLGLHTIATLDLFVVFSPY